MGSDDASQLGKHSQLGLLMLGFGVGLGFPEKKFYMIVDKIYSHELHPFL